MPADTPVPNPAKAHLPELSDEFIAKNYPSTAKVIHVDVVHRHGERTPAFHTLGSISPKHWNFCKESNKLHAEFLKTISKFTHGENNNGQTKWKSDIFKGNSRDVAKAFGVKNANKGQHSLDDSVLSSSTCEFGQLTDVGRQSMTALGEHLRELYIGRLGYMPARPRQFGSMPTEDLYLRSTSYTRSFESLHQLLFGLYPSVSLGSPVFRINIRPTEAENLFPSFDCRGMVTRFKKFNKKAAELFAGEYEHLLADLKRIPELSELFDHAGGGRKKMPISLVAQDTLLPMRAHGMELPEKITDELLTRVTMMSSVEYLHSAFKSPEVARLQIGPFVRELVDNMISVVQAERAGKLGSVPKMGVYSGHDTTIAPLLAVFGDGLTGPAIQAPVGILWPPFASSLRIELLKDTQSSIPPTRPSWEDDQPNYSDKTPAARLRPINVTEDLYRWPKRRHASSESSSAVNPRATRDYYVRVWYNDRVLQLPTCRDPGAHHSSMGSTVCTLEGFFKQVARYVPSEKEYSDECNLIKS